MVPHPENPNTEENNRKDKKGANSNEERGDKGEEEK